MSTSTRSPTLAVCTVILVGAGGVGLWALLAEQGRSLAQRRRADTAEQMARSQQSQAKDHLARAEAAERDAKERLAAVEKLAALGITEAAFRSARQAVDDCFDIVRNDPLFTGRVLSEDQRRLKRLLLEKMLPFHEQQLAHSAPRHDQWKKHRRVAYILMQLGRHEDALEQTRQAEDLARGMAEEESEENLGPRANLAATLDTKARLLRGLGQREAARSAFAEAAQARRRLARKAHPGQTAAIGYLADTLTQLGSLQANLGESRPALTSLAEAIGLRAALLQEWPDALVHQEGLASAQALLQLLLRQWKLGDSALTSPHGAQELHQVLARARPQPNAEADLVDVLTTLASLLEGLDEPGEALKAYTLAVTRGRALVQAHPDVTGYRADLASTLTHLGTLQRDLGQPAEARKALTESIGLSRELSRANPLVPRYREAMAGALNNLGLAQVDLGKSSEALKAYAEAAALRRELVRQHPEAPGYLVDLADTLTNAGALFSAGGQAGQAVGMHLGAVTNLRALARAYPEVTESYEGLASAWSNLGVALQALGRRDEALRPAAEAARLWRALVRLEPTVPGYRADLAGALNNLGALHADRGRAEMALRCFTEAIERGRGLVQGKTGVVRYRVELCQALLNRAQLHRAGREEARAKADLDEVVVLLTGHAEGSAVAATLRLFAHEERARVMLEQGKPREALADWARALALAPAERRAAVRLGRADCLARAGQHEAAAAEAVAVSRQRPLAAETTFDAACVLAVSAAAAWRDAGLPLPVRERQADDRAREAVALLRGLRQAGHFRGELRTEPDLDFLRGRADFRALLARGK